MSTHKHFDKICYGIIALCVVITLVMMKLKSYGVNQQTRILGYEDKIFDTTRVHTIDIVMNDWDFFIRTCTNEEYQNCTVVIDNESYKDVAIRAKGNTSLTNVASYGNDRYSFKIEFDHYDKNKSYYGLDKLVLNNIIQDNTYMKDYITYQMMGKFGVASPLCSFAYIRVNGDDWGLYLCVEAVEDSFLERNYTTNEGELYKPDSVSFGGENGDPRDGKMQEGMNFPEGMNPPEGMELPEGMNPPTGTDATSSATINGKNTTETKNSTDGVKSEGTDSSTSDKEVNEMRPPQGDGDRKGGMNSDDVALVYTDDNYESYSNIFDNAKTKIKDKDKERLIRCLQQLNEQKNIEEVVDIEKVIRYFAIHNFVVNFDSYTGSIIHNYYLYECNGKMQMIPWDYNLAFGTFMGGSDATSMINYPIDTPVSGGNVDSRPMIAWIFASEEYTALYHEVMNQFIEDFFESGYFENMITSVTEMIQPYVEKDPTKFCTYEEFIDGINALKDFCTLRAESVKRQLSGEIPTTQSGQKESSDKIVSGATLSLQAMGSMHGNGFGPQNQMNNKQDDQKEMNQESSKELLDDGVKESNSNKIDQNQESKQNQLASDQEKSQESSQEQADSDQKKPQESSQKQIDSDSKNPKDGWQRSKNPNEDDNNEKGWDMNWKSQQSEQTNPALIYVLLGGSIIVLVIAVIFVSHYHRRKN